MLVNANARFFRGDFCAPPKTWLTQGERFSKPPSQTTNERGYHATTHFPTYHGSLASGCAYILSTDSQYISISSSPAGAQVMIKTTGGIEVFTGTTPAQAHLKRKNEYIIDVTLEGHKPQQIHLEQSINPKTFWNLVNGGIGGWIIDGVTGAIWNLEPETITITLQTASVDGEERQLLVFSWLNEQGEPIHQAVDVSD